MPPAKVTATASLVGQLVKNPPAMQETQVRSLGREDPLEKGMSTHSRILAWRIPWTEERGGLQFCSLAQGHLPLFAPSTVSQFIVCTLGVSPVGAGTRHTESCILMGRGTGTLTQRLPPPCASPDGNPASSLHPPAEPTLSVLLICLGK